MLTFLMQETTGFLETVLAWCDGLILVPQDITQHQGFPSHHHLQPTTLVMTPLRCITCSKCDFSAQVKECWDQVIIKTLDLTRPEGHHTDHSSNQDTLFLSATLSSDSLLVCFSPQLLYSWLPQASESQPEIPRPKTTGTPGNNHPPWSSKEKLFWENFLFIVFSCDLSLKGPCCLWWIDP